MLSLVSVFIPSLPLPCSPLPGERCGEVVFATADSVGPVLKLSQLYPDAVVAVSTEGNDALLRTVYYNGKKDQYGEIYVLPGSFVESHCAWVQYLWGHEYKTARRTICLTRVPGESIHIRSPHEVAVVTVKEITKQRARLLVSTNTEVDVWRSEIDCQRNWLL